MRRWIEGWHVGQLVLAWVALAVAWCLAVLGAVVTSGARDEAASVREARAELARDSAVRADSSRLTMILDSGVRLVKAAGLDSANSYSAAQGLLSKSDREWKKAIARGNSRDPFRLLALLVGVLIVLPIGGYAMTWIWFGGRRRLGVRP